MIIKYKNNFPKIHPKSFVAENSTIIGDVKLAKNSSVYFGCVLRGDINHISIGENTNIQDLTVIHTMNDQPCIIGKNVVVGHNVNLHACVVGDESLIGIGATILSYAHIGKGSIIAAGTIIPERKIIPDGVVVMGVPGKIIREVTELEKKGIIDTVNEYIEFIKHYKN